MPAFCRHNRFVQRCPICSPAHPGHSADQHSTNHAIQQTQRTTRRVGQSSSSTTMRVRRELRAEDDGYRSGLVPGLRSSRDATRLVQEIAYASGRLKILQSDPPGLYAEIRAQRDLEQATWMCFLTCYLCPLETGDPFVGIRAALEQAGDWSDGVLPDLAHVPLGIRSSHDPARGESTLIAYRRWAQNSGSQVSGFRGEEAWSPQRRFQRLFERLSLPGFSRFARYEVLLTLGALGLYDVQADALHLIDAPARASADPTTMAAKRVFAIGDVPNLERRAIALAQATTAPLGALDLALSNWAAQERATFGFSADISDALVSEHARDALGL